MVQGAPQTAGRFDEEVRMYKAPPPEVSTEEFYETDPAKAYQRGFSIQNVSPLPITWAEHVAAQGHWGEALREYMRDYMHWATLGRAVRTPAPARQPGHPGRREGPPRPAGGPLLLHPVRQRQAAGQGAPSGHGGHPARRRSGRGHDHRPLRPPGRRGCRMAAAEGTGWSTASCRTFAVPNLYITDGSVLPTQGVANPALTIMALAARCADHLAARARTGGRVMTSDPVIEPSEDGGPTPSPPTRPRRTAPWPGTPHAWSLVEAAPATHRPGLDLRAAAAPT